MLLGLSAQTHHESLHLIPLCKQLREQTGPQQEKKNESRSLVLQRDSMSWSPSRVIHGKHHDSASWKKWVVPLLLGWLITQPLHTRLTLHVACQLSCTATGLKNMSWWSYTENITTQPGERNESCRCCCCCWLAHHPTAAHKTHTSCCMSTPMNQFFPIHESIFLFTSKVSLSMVSTISC
jgi:hypothetical protein